MRSLRPLLVCLAIVQCVRAASDDLLAFHVRNADFKPVEPANWVREGALKAFVGLDDATVIDELAELGVTIIHTGGPRPYYPLVKDDPKSGLPANEKAALLAGVRRAKKHSMRVILGIAPMAPIEIVRKHPEWMVHLTDDDSVRKNAALDLTRPENFRYRALGLDSPYGDYLIECLAEIMRNYQVDGFSFDGNYHPWINYAPYHKELYKRQTHRDVPKVIDLSRLDYRVYLIWAGDMLEAWYRKLHERLRQVNPEAAVYTWTTNAGRYGHFLTSPRVMSARMNMLFDCPVQEWWLDEMNLGASVVPAFGAAYVRAVAGGRLGACEPYIISRGNPPSAESFPRHELITRSMSAMTNGAFTPLSLSAGKEATYETFRQIRLRKPWLIRTEQIPWAGVLVSEQSRQFYGSNVILDRYLAHPLGVYRVAWEEHLPLNLITDWDLRPERLARYKVLFLANSACLSDEQARTIRNYVAGGGGLVASCEASLYDEIGRPRDDFALADLFGVSFQGRPKDSGIRPARDATLAVAVNDAYWAHRKGVAALRWGAGDLQTLELVDDDQLKALVPHAQATFKGPWVKITEPKAPMKKAMIMFPDAGPDAVVAAVMGDYGKGRVVYLAAGLDAANFSYAYPYQRRLVARAMRWAAREPFPIDVAAPMCVQSTYFRQADARGKRIIVQLFNGLNTTSDHGLPEMDVPLREESVPISGIQVRLTGLKVKQVHLEPGGHPLQPAKSGESLQVSVPPLEIHAMVVAELE